MRYLIQILLLWFILFFLQGCKSGVQEVFSDQVLTDNWQFRKTGETNWLPAHVPGCVIYDLVKNKKLIDPVFRFDKTKIDTIEKTPWEYRNIFSLSPELIDQDEMELRFDGLDTHCEVFLNDSLLLQANNMFRTYQVKCKSLIKEKNNCLLIRFHPVASSFDNPNRKALYQSGSANNPEIISCGIWKPVHLIAWSSAKIVNLYFQQQSVTSKLAKYTIDCGIDSKRDQQLKYDIYINNKLFKSSIPAFLKKGVSHQFIPVEIEKPRLWWCNGLGAPYLYKITVKLKEDNQVVHEITTSLGIRKLELVEVPGSAGGKYRLLLNHIPVYIKGSVLLPGHLMPSQVNPDFYDQITDQARDLNLNLLRIWDKGIYENQLFYDLCDEKGILVWQAFMDENKGLWNDSLTIDSYREELKDVIFSLRNHPSLAIWSNLPLPETSSSEIKANLREDENARRLESKKIKDKIFYDLFNRPMAMNDPNTLFISTTQETNTNKSKIETGVLCQQNKMREEKRLKFYNAVSFILAIPSYPFLRSFYSHLPLYGTSQDSIAQNYPKNQPAYDLRIMDDIQRIFHVSPHPASQAYLSQVIQSQTLKTAMEAKRSDDYSCQGLIFQQLNDCWPSVTGSLIDFYSQWKLSAYTVRNALSPILVIPRLEDNSINIQLVNDTKKIIDAILLVKLINFNGKDLFVKQIPVKIDSNSKKLVLSLNKDDVLGNTDPRTCCMIVQLNQPSQTLIQNILYFTEPQNLQLQVPSIDIVVNEAVKGYNLILKSNVLAKNVFLETIKKECFFNDNNFDLIPGKRTKINIRYSGSRDEFLKDLKIKSLVDFK